jgi:hypothetical protein
MRISQGAQMIAIGYDDVVLAGAKNDEAVTVVDRITHWMLPARTRGRREKGNAELNTIPTKPSARRRPANKPEVTADANSLYHKPLRPVASRQERFLGSWLTILPSEESASKANSVLGRSDKGP